MKNESLEKISLKPIKCVSYKKIAAINPSN